MHASFQITIYKVSNLEDKLIYWGKCDQFETLKHCSCEEGKLKYKIIFAGPILTLCTCNLSVNLEKLYYYYIYMFFVTCQSFKHGVSTSWSVLPVSEYDLHPIHLKVSDSFIFITTIWDYAYVLPYCETLLWHVCICAATDRVYICVYICMCAAEWSLSLIIYSSDSQTKT